MSAASGSQSKEAIKKYKAVNINNIYKGKTADTSSKTVITKHGMQSLGKVPSCRRIAPANLPSIKAENFGNDPNVNLVPVGGQGWGNKGEETSSVNQTTEGSSNFAENQLNCTEGPTKPQSYQVSATNALTKEKQLEPSSANLGTNSRITENGLKPGAAPLMQPGVGGGGGPVHAGMKPGGVAVPWNTTLAHGPAETVHAPPPQPDGGHPASGSVQQSPLFHREFPTLGGAGSHSDSGTQYGPGPSLRPETKRSWVISGGPGSAPPAPDDADSSGRVSGKTNFNGRPNNMGPRGSPPGPYPPNAMPGESRPDMIRGPPPMGHQGMPPPFKGFIPPYMRGPPMPRSGMMPPGHPPPMFGGRGYRGQGPPLPDDHVAPPPIIKKEDIDNFESLPPESDGWANSVGDVDYNKKLNFSEDEASVEDEKITIKQKPRKTNENSQQKLAPPSQKQHENVPTRGIQNAWEKKEQYRKMDSCDKGYPPSDMSQWPHHNAKTSYDRSLHQKDFSRKSASPSYANDNEDAKRDFPEVKSALERARHLHMEEEKRYEEKKKYENSKNASGGDFSSSHKKPSRDFDHADNVHHAHGPVRGGGGPPGGGRDRDKENESPYYQDSSNAARDKESWDSVPESSLERMRNPPPSQGPPNRGYRNYDRRDPDGAGRDSFKDQYDTRHDPRREQPVFSASFKNKLPPRFQKQKQQQQQQDFHHRNAPYRPGQQQPPSLFDMRCAPQGRHPNREGLRSGRPSGDGDPYFDEDQNSGRNWNGSWQSAAEDRDHGWDEHPSWSGDYDRHEYDKERDRDTRGWNQKDKRDYLNRKSGGDSRNDIDEKPKRFESGGRGYGGDNGQHQHWSGPEPGPDSKSDHVRRFDRGSYREEDFKDRPQRPESRDSRASRDSAGSYRDQRKPEFTSSWADSTTEFDEADPRDDKLADGVGVGGSGRQGGAGGGGSGYSESETHKENLRSVMAPAPITKERLEASETEKEVRKNMTTLRRGQGPPPPTPASSQETRKSVLKDNASPEDKPASSSWLSSKSHYNSDRPRSDVPTMPPPLIPNYKSSKSGAEQSSNSHHDKGSSGNASNSNQTETGSKKVENVWKLKEREDAAAKSDTASHNNELANKDNKTLPTSKNLADPAKDHSVNKTNNSSSHTENKKLGSASGTSSSSTNNDTITNDSSKLDKSKDKPNQNKDKLSSQKPNSSKSLSRYDDGRGTGPAAGRGKPRVAMGSYPAYGRGRGAGRMVDYNRRAPIRTDMYSRMQPRGYRQDYYYYDYPQPMKDPRSDRYGSWGRGGDPRRHRMHNMRPPVNISEVPSLMDAEIRKHPNNYYERVPPRFQRKRDQETGTDPAQKKDKYGKSGSGSGSGQGPASSGRQSDKKSSSGAGSYGYSKDSSGDGFEDADWETASESSDHERSKDSAKAKSVPVRGDRRPLRTDRKTNNARGFDSSSKDKHANSSSFSSTKPFENRRLASPLKSDRSSASKSAGFSGHNAKFSKYSTESGPGDTADGDANDKMARNGAAKPNPNALDGIDLNNFASVVIVDNQPETGDDAHDSNSGFQEVTRRKGPRDKSRADEDSGSPGSGHDSGSSFQKRKDKKKPKNGANPERSRQVQAPRLVKRKETVRSTATNGNSSLPAETSVAPPPAKNAWEKPLTTTLRTNSPHTFNNAECAQENHDSGVEVSDPPNSTGSSQRSSPSDNPVFSRQDKGAIAVTSSSQEKMCGGQASIMNFASCVDKTVLDGSSVPSQTIIFENTNYKVGGSVGSEYKSKFGGSEPHKKPMLRDRKTNSSEDPNGLADDAEKKSKPEPIELPLSFKSSESSVGEMKLDFTFDHELADLSSEKTAHANVRSMTLTSPSSPSTHDLNLKIASVKKVWDTMTPLTEHPEDAAASSFSPASFCAVENAPLDHAPGLETFSCKESMGVEDSASDMSYQAASLQQVSVMNAVTMDYTTALNKTDVARSVGVSRIKPDHDHVTAMNLASHALPGTSISPPLASMGQSSSMYLGATPAFGGLGGAAIPSPPTVMLNSSQQLQQTGLYPPLFDGTTVLGQRGASQFSQFPYGNIPGLGNSAAAFGQQSLFLQTPPLSAPADLYTNNLSQYRVQPNPVTGFGQTHSQPQNQSTVLISSASSTLMSSAVKPSSHSFGSSQQNFGTIGSKAGTHFQQSGLSGTLPGNTIQSGPQPFVLLDPNHPISLLNSPLVQRTGVHNSVMQAIQQPNSFYSSNAAATPAVPPTAPPGGSAQQAAANFYAASQSPLPAAVQQQAQSALQGQAFGLQNFANQSGPAPVGIQNFGSGTSLTQQQIPAQMFRNLPGQQQSQQNFLKSLQPSCGANPDVNRQQMKSPGLVHNSLSNTYFPSSSVSPGISMNNCNGANSGGCVMPGANSSSVNLGMNGAGGGGGPTMSQMSSSAKCQTQSRKMAEAPSMVAAAGASRLNANASYNTQNTGQMNNMSGLRNNMSVGMANQLGMSPHSMSPSSSMSGSGSYPGPGPIQRPPLQQQQHPSGPMSAVHRSSRANPAPPTGPPPMHSGPGPTHRGANPSSAQQAKLRAEALSATQAFFARDAGQGGKCEKKSTEKSSSSGVDCADEPKTSCESPLIGADSSTSSSAAPPPSEIAK